MDETLGRPLMLRAGSVAASGGGNGGLDGGQQAPAFEFAPAPHIIALAGWQLEAFSGGWVSARDGFSVLLVLMRAHPSH
eukprot:6238581-Alexandrium_andersonii.AAC.1